MLVDGKQFDTNAFFSGGAGIFMQYYDIIKPIYLFAIYKMIMLGFDFGLPIDIISSMNKTSVVEWYTNRRFKNPLRCLDYKHQIDPVILDDILKKIISDDISIYSLCPIMNIGKMLDIYVHQRMVFPVYIYTEEEDPFVREDCKSIFRGINYKYIYGDLGECIKKCDQNFTYIFSDIELVKESSEILNGTCSHILLAREYRYNYIDNCKTLKYDLHKMALSHPFIRIGTMMVFDFIKTVLAFN